MNITMTPSDWLDLATHFASLSLLGVGGAITTTPEMQRYLVLQQHWLSPQQFGNSIALAQAAPGPNILFIALMGWNVGLNAAGGLGAGATAWWQALLGMALAMLGSLLPSCTLNYLATRWAHRNQHLLAVRAFKTGMSPIVIGLLLSIGWLLSAAHDQPARDWPLWLLTACTTLLVWKTRLHLLVLMATGALLGSLGLV
jgi:chromate transporter